MITNILDVFKIVPCVVIVLYQSCFLHNKTLGIPQNLSNQIVLKVLNAKLQQNSEIYILLKSLQDRRSKERSKFDLCNMCF